LYIGRTDPHDPTGENTIAEGVKVIHAAVASQLENARVLKVGLNKTHNADKPVKFDGSSYAIIPVEGILSPEHGGTGISFTDTMSNKGLLYGEKGTFSMKPIIDPIFDGIDLTSAEQGHSGSNYNFFIFYAGFQEEGASAREYIIVPRR
jgi:hypothetical protein